MITMTAEFDREESFATVMAQISVLPAHQRTDALLAFFVQVINAMDADTVRGLRNQVMARFSTCGCSFETMRLMLQFIDGHLALRELSGKSHVGTGN